MSTTIQSSIHQFIVKDTQGNDVPLSNFKDKVLLIVNTASKCGFTPQLGALEKLYAEYKDKGLEILAFPSNDFNGQEPLEGDRIKQFCTLEYRASYPIFDKIHVKGKEAHPLYKFLSKKKYNGKVNSKPMWNFHKYLLNKNGEVIDFFYTTTSPTAVRVKRAIEELLEV